MSPKGFLSKRRAGGAVIVLLSCFLSLWALQATPARAVGLKFNPAIIGLASGESKYVYIEAEGVSQETGLKAYQFTLQFDSGKLVVSDPNYRDDLGGLSVPYSPLGGVAGCSLYRGGDVNDPCPDPEWMLISSGRTAACAPAQEESGSLTIACGSYGDDSGLPWGDGTLAVIKVTNIGAENAAVQFAATDDSIPETALVLGHGLSQGVTTRGLTVEIVSSKPGDLDSDGDVDNDDYAIVKTVFGKCSGDPGYLRAANFDTDACITINDVRILRSLVTFVRGDLDGDGDGDGDDYVIMRAMYGKCDGDGGYDPKADMDGDNCITIRDIKIFRSLLR